MWWAGGCGWGVGMHVVPVSGLKHIQCAAYILLRGNGLYFRYRIAMLWCGVVDCDVD